jgi:hypothetical protein
MARELRNHENETKIKLERQQEEKKRREKELIDNKIKLRKE